MSADLVLRLASQVGVAARLLRLRYVNTTSTPIVSATWLDSGCAIADVYTLTVLTKVGTAATVKVECNVKNPYQNLTGVSCIADGSTPNTNLIPGVAIVLSGTCDTGHAAKLSVGADMDNAGVVTDVLDFGVVQAGLSTDGRPHRLRERRRLGGAADRDVQPPRAVLRRHRLRHADQVDQTAQQHRPPQARRRRDALDHLRQLGDRRHHGEEEGRRQGRRHDRDRGRALRRLDGLRVRRRATATSTAATCWPASRSCSPTPRSTRPRPRSPSRSRTAGTGCSSRPTSAAPPAPTPTRISA